MLVLYECDEIHARAVIESPRFSDKKPVVTPSVKPASSEEEAERCDVMPPKEAPDLWLNQT